MRVSKVSWKNIFKKIGFLLDMNILSILKQWRNEQARREGVEIFRIVPNRTLEEIALVLPQTSEALLDIHGIGERKVKKYGKEILGIVTSYQVTRLPVEKKISNLKSQISNKNSKISNSNPTSNFNIPNSHPAPTSNFEIPNSKFEDLSQKIVSVGEFLDRTNAVLAEMPGAVRGEVSSADVRERYVFFTIKDGEDNASLSVFMWRNQYDLCGVRAEEGAEVIVRGQLDIYKPSGRLSFRANSMELVGEGAIKAAYDRLKNSLEVEGLFALEKKRPLKEFPHRIGLITSKEGAVIHDFMSNIGQFGFHIAFVNSRVEGALAVTELLRAMRMLKTHPIDVLVMIRGGGSLESLAAFNNETIVREIATFPVPVICGIGHDRDVPLASLVADKMVSTPTAVTRELNASWERAVSRVDIFERDLMNRFERELAEKKNAFQKNTQFIVLAFSHIVDRCRRAEEKLRNCLSLFKSSLSFFHQRMNVMQKNMLIGFESLTNRVIVKLDVSEQSIVQSDPRRQLKLGYGIISYKGKVVRSVADVSTGDDISILLSDGKVESKVHKVVKSIKS